MKLDSYLENIKFAYGQEAANQYRIGVERVFALNPDWEFDPFSDSMQSLLAKVIKESTKKQFEGVWKNLGIPTNSGMVETIFDNEE